MRLNRVALAVAGCLLSLAAVIPSIVNAQEPIRNVPAAKSPRIFVSIKGVVQGQFAGDAVAMAHKGEIAASSFSFELAAPTDPATGAPSGKRQYKPLVFTHSIGAATPQLFSAVTKNEVLSSVKFVVVKPTVTGAEMDYYTVTLTNAHLASVRQYTVDGDPMEEVTLTFQKISIEVGGKSTIDSWSAM